MTDQTTQESGTAEQAAAAYAANEPQADDRRDGASADGPDGTPVDASAAAEDADGAVEDRTDGQGEAEHVDDPEQRAADDGRSPGELLVALEQAEAQRDEYLDALQRRQAEFENFRRRTTREAAGAREAGAGDLAIKLLDVLDDLDRTVEVAHGSDDQGLAGGITAIHRKLAEALRGAGVERIDETDVPFDATRHEAVQQVPAEEPVDEPEVASVLRPGYQLGDRCLRAAMVAVRQ